MVPACGGVIQGAGGRARWKFFLHGLGPLPVFIMEDKARAERERPVDSDQESSPALPPLLHPPDNLQSHRITNFYIDTILRPDFGRRRKDGVVREGNGLREILRTEQLRAGKKSAKTGSPRQGGAGASDDRHPDSEGQRPDLRAATGAVEDGSQAGSAPAAKPMLWPAWVYRTRYSDRPSAGWWSLAFNHCEICEWVNEWMSEWRPVSDQLKKTQL